MRIVNLKFRVNRQINYLKKNVFEGKNKRKKRSLLKFWPITSSEFVLAEACSTQYD